MHLELEPKVLRVELDRRIDVIDDVTDLHRGHLIHPSAAAARPAAASRG